MFIPNSPKPPSGMALSFPFRDEILVLLNRSHCPLSAENRLKRAQNLALFGVFEAAKEVCFEGPPGVKSCVVNKSLASFRQK
jgi:hypothetical protein